MRKPSNKFDRGLYFDYECPQCEKTTECHILFGCPAQLSGPPERCYPAEPDEVEPSTCPFCGMEWDESRMGDDARDEHARRWEAAADYANED